MSAIEVEVIYNDDEEEVSLTMCEATSGLHTNGLEWRISWCPLGSWKSKQQLHVSSIMRFNFIIDGSGRVDVFRWMGMYLQTFQVVSRSKDREVLHLTGPTQHPDTRITWRITWHLIPKHEHHVRAPSKRLKTSNDYGSGNVVMY